MKDVATPTYVEDSFSRQLDKKVAKEEMPYGYSGNPPAADSSNDGDMKSRQSKKRY